MYVCVSYFLLRSDITPLVTDKSNGIKVSRLIAKEMSFDKRRREKHLLFPWIETCGGVG